MKNAVFKNASNKSGKKSQNRKTKLISIIIFYSSYKKSANIRPENSWKASRGRASQVHEQVLQHKFSDL